MNNDSPAPPRQLLFFLKPLQAMTLYNIITIYEELVEKNIAAGQADLADHTSKDAIIAYRRQLMKQFGNEELDDLKEDLEILELFNPPEKK